ncbi:nitrogen fixation protein NifQ [Shewanella surugensis]|uniref:Nitrogen fixation protein NifQ n=1 Tax=Shewanella surugensis TaxID=212020 RepID=A0ABT0LFW3_9GAMM|nr:nitrogen fixation protein NifQ [Shewanella surugensis]MCL1126578.1 nitrogen fixation protein NifQ [Shewanella surugensis]
MEQVAAIDFYINGLRKNQTSSISSDVSYGICAIQPASTVMKEREEMSIHTLRSLSDYWQDMTWEVAIDEIERFSQLIVLNPGPLAFYDDLIELLTEHLSIHEKQMALWWAHKMVIACCGRTHLYIDIGFEAREKMTILFNRYFPTLAKKNIDNKMRWKKFLYRQFCLAAQLPLCPTASCSECPSYQECYSGS